MVRIFGRLLEVKIFRGGLVNFQDSGGGLHKGGGWRIFRIQGGFRFCGHQDFSGGVETPCQAMKKFA